MPKDKGFILLKDDERKRWRVKLPEGWRAKYFGADNYQDFQAMSWCIKVAWASYGKYSKKPCPWTFEGDDALNMRA